MKSIITKSIYAGLGLIGTGKDTIEELGRKVARKVNVSEKDGEKIARQLRSKSQKAITSIQKTLDAEVNKVAHALHLSIHTNVVAAKKSKASSKPKARRHVKTRTKSGPKAVH